MSYSWMVSFITWYLTIASKHIFNIILNDLLLNYLSHALCDQTSH